MSRGRVTPAGGCRGGHPCRTRMPGPGAALDGSRNTCKSRAALQTPLQTPRPSYSEHIAERSGALRRAHAGLTAGGEARESGHGVRGCAARARATYAAWLGLPSAPRHLRQSRACRMHASAAAAGSCGPAATAAAAAERRPPPAFAPAAPVCTLHALTLRTVSHSGHRDNLDLCGGHPGRTVCGLWHRRQ